MADHAHLLAKRHRAARRFRLICRGAIFLALGFLAWFFTDIILQGYTAFRQAELRVAVTYSAESVEVPPLAVEEQLRGLVSRSWLRLLPNHVETNPELLGSTREQWVLADDQVDQYLKGRYSNLAEDEQVLVASMRDEGLTRMRFNRTFFTSGDSKIPEHSGLFSALVGSALVLILTLLFAFPVGVMTAVYLEEFAGNNWLTQTIEVNINNLAAVPSIIYGLLGLAIFINFFGVPRSSALVGGLTLGIMTLPVIIISTRAALRAVPKAIREAAFGVGASRWQVVRDHVLPLSLPGILTGTIIGLARAAGETAPLLIVGMIAFIPDAPNDFLDPTTVLPAQIFTWAGMPERAYVSRTAAGIIVLLTLILALNALAIYLRNRFQKRW